jgi:peptidoglycan L-alanyl-D-glutamate endopeptidase CwlK
MTVLSKASTDKLSTCDQRLQRVFHEVAARWPGGDISILCGHRNEADQNQAFAEGRSKKRWPDGEHNSLPSKAVDAVPTEITAGVRKIDWNDRERITLFAGFVIAVGLMLGIRLRWGGDWDSDTDVKENGFDDLVHFELAP